MEEIERELQERLKQIQRTAHVDPVEDPFFSSREIEPHFFSRSEVERVLNLDDIRRCLARIPVLEGNERDVRRYASIVRQSSLLVFATLLIDGNEKHILGFIFRRDSDERFPYHESDLDYLPQPVRSHFVRSQWQFNPVVLGGNRIHRDVPPDAIIPIMSERKVGAGAFGTVWETRLYPSCQLLVTQDENQDVIIARKQLCEGVSGANERVVLDLVRELEHPNIINFLGSYRYHDACNLLFPLATMDLREFLLTDTRPSMDTRSIYAAIHGLADALSHIHNFTIPDKDGEANISKVGYHHDLRPANLLVHRGTFVIADFGLSQLRPDDRASPTTLNGGVDEYLGPESFDYNDWTNGSVGRALDVWAFGCIIAELATFLRGWDVAVFRSRRERTNRAFHLDGRLHPEVTVWLDELAEDTNDPQLPGLVQVAREMLNPNPYRRPRVADLAPRLKLLAINSAFDTVSRRFQALVAGGRDDGAANANANANPGPNVFAFLEHARIQTWHAVFESLHSAVKLDHATAALQGLTKLCELLDAHPSGGTDQAPPAAALLPPDILADIDMLCEALPDDRREGFSDLWSRRVCDMDDVRILEAIRLASKPERYRLVGIGAAMKHMSVAISKSIKFGRRSRYLDSAVTELDRDDRHVSTPSSGLLVRDDSKTMGYLAADEGGERRQVLVEWKVYEASWKNRASDLHLVMDDLVNLLDPEATPRTGVALSRIPNCLGYFHEARNFRFGFVYALPSAAATTAGKEAHLMISINNVIRLTTGSEEETGRPQVSMPDLGDIFLLAKDLAACLLEVHRVGWLHKNLSSHHILVFSPSVDLVGQHVASAVLTGFNDSRPEASSFTLGPTQDLRHYRHPAYVAGTAFRWAFDYFGLGLVLLELGLWLTIPDLRVEHRDDSHEAFRLKLLDSYVPQLGATTGALYRDAVLFCLDAETAAGREGLDPKDAGAMHSMFKERVVDVLSRCFA